MFFNPIVIIRTTFANGFWSISDNEKSSLNLITKHKSVTNNLSS